MWFLRLLPKKMKKKIVVGLLEDILSSKNDTIDNNIAERIVSIVIKSSGNNVISFIIKD